MIKNHAVVQGYNFFHYLGLDRNMRDKISDHPYYQRTLRFVNLYDDLAFDASKPKLELSLFEAMVKEVLAKPINSLYQKAL